jgi:carboxylesterase type B
VVTYNYRRIFVSLLHLILVGILGFLDAPGFPTVNMGLQDTILALKWVQLNCLFFGGNPKKITSIISPKSSSNVLVFGESSGGQMIRALMASPKAKGLFVRAILQSDPQSYPLENRTISQGVVGEYALSQLGCTTLSCAQGLSLSAIVAATTLVAEVAPDLNLAVPITPLSPTIDGTWVAGDWSALIASGDLPNAVDVIMGMLTSLPL